MSISETLMAGMMKVHQDQAATAYTEALEEIANLRTALNNIQQFAEENYSPGNTAAAIVRQRSLNEIYAISFKALRGDKITLMEDKD